MTKANQSIASRPKQAMEVEQLLSWAFREELPKRLLSAQEARWDAMAVSGPFGPVDEGLSVQRYAYVGAPHPDALFIEEAVNALPLVVIDWEESLDAIMGDLAGLVSINDLRRDQEERGRVTQSSWPARTYSKTCRRERSVNAPRDVLLVGSLQAAELVATHARQGTRPRWYREHPRCHPTPSRDPSKAMLIGQSGGRNGYSIGSHCPVRWGIKHPDDKWGDRLITPVMIAMARADYIAWWRGLSMLAETLALDDHAALPPAAPRLPWFDAEPGAALYGHPSPLRMPMLPLKAPRDVAGRTRGQSEDVRKRAPGRTVSP